MNNTEHVRYIVLRGLEGNAPTQFGALQEFLYPYLPSLITAWWCVFFGTILFLVTRHILVPLIFKRTS